MPTKLDIIRRVATNHVFSPDINWDALPQDVGDAAVVRGDPFVRREFIEQVIGEARRGKIQVEAVFPNGTPSLLKLYELAFERQRQQNGGSRTSSRRSILLDQANTARRSRAQRLGRIKPLDS